MLKRFSFLFALIALTFSLVACDELEDTSSGDDSENKEEEAKDEKYGVGDTAEVSGVKFTLNKVSTTDERNEFEEEEPNEVIKVEFELENNSDEEISVGGDLQVYDGTGNQVDSYANENTMGSLKPGKKMQGVDHFGIEEGPVEIYFQPMMSFDDDEAIFEADVE